jgi:hypothetical protein
LGSSSSLTEPTIDAFVSECAGEFLSDPAITEEIGGDPPLYMLQEGSTWNMLDQPSKLCTQTLLCVFKDCFNPDWLALGDYALR